MGVVGYGYGGVTPDKTRTRRDPRRLKEVLMTKNRIDRLKRLSEMEPDNNLLKSMIAIEMVRVGKIPTWENAKNVFPGCSYLIARKSGNPCHIVLNDCVDSITSICGLGLSLNLWNCRWEGNNKPDSLCKVCKNTNRFKFLKGQKIWGSRKTEIPESWRSRYGWVKVKFIQDRGPYRRSEWQYKRESPFWTPNPRIEHDPQMKMFSQID